MGSPEQFYRNPDHDTRPTTKQQAWAKEQEAKRLAAEAAKAAKEARNAYENELYEEFKADVTKDDQA